MAEDTRTVNRTGSAAPAGPAPWSATDRRKHSGRLRELPKKTTPLLTMGRVYAEPAYTPRQRRGADYVNRWFVRHAWPQSVALVAPRVVRCVPRVGSTRVTQTQGALGPYSSCCE